MKKLLLMAVGVALAGASSVNAGMTVYETSVSPGEVINITSTGGGISGGVWAGIYNLTVATVATPSFCIDVFRYSPSGQSDYNYLALASSPLTPAGPMGAGAATTIEQLWYANFSAAQTSDATAAALQLAIWQTVATGGGYSVTSSGQVATDAAAMLTALQGPGQHPTVSLRGLVSPTMQNYVVPVPEPTTMVAGLGGLGLALLGVFGSRRSSVIKIGQ